MLVPSSAPPHRGAGANHPPIHGQAPVAGGHALRAAPFPWTKGFLRVAGSVCSPSLLVRDLGAATKPICSQLLLCL